MSLPNSSPWGMVWERPLRAARVHVEAPHPPRRGLPRDVIRRDRRRGDDGVADDQGRGLHRVEQGVQPVAVAAAGAGDVAGQVDAPVLAEVGARPPGSRVHAEQEAVARAPEDALGRPVRPVRDAPLIPARGHGGGARLVGLRVVDPQGLPGRRVHGRALRRRHVDEEPAADHQRRRLEVVRVGRLAVAPALGVGRVEGPEDDVRPRPPLAAAGRRHADPGVGRLPAPGDLEVAEVAGVDLVEGRVLGAADVAAVGRPLAVGRRPLLRRHGRRGQQCRRQHPADRVNPSRHRRRSSLVSIPVTEAS